MAIFYGKNRGNQIVARSGWQFSAVRIREIGSLSAAAAFSCRPRLRKPEKALKNFRHPRKASRKSFAPPETSENQVYSASFAKLHFVLSAAARNRPGNFLFIDGRSLWPLRTSHLFVQARHLPDSGRRANCKCAQKGAAFSGWKPRLGRCSRTTNSKSWARHDNMPG